MNGERTILLVEDNPDDELLMQRALRKNLIQNPLVVARDGIEALEWLFATGPHAGRDWRELPVVVLLDLHMPRLDGLGVLRAMRADPRTALVPVVMLTTSREEADIVASYEAGVNSYVQKPVALAEFTEAMRGIGLYWLVTNHGPPDPT
jgi:two-component system response regulator